MIRGSGYGDGCVVRVLLWLVAQANVHGPVLWRLHELEGRGSRRRDTLIGYGCRGTWYDHHVLHSSSLKLRNLRSLLPAGVCMVSL